MKPACNVLGEYADAFRALVNARVQTSAGEPSQLIRMNRTEDWEFLCVAMDVIGDAGLAVDNFLQFSLDGPTRYESIGEKYLRLYGLLSATYLQQESMLKLYKLMNCPDPKDIFAKFKALKVRRLRHQVASHSVDYRNDENGVVQSFVPVRMGLHGFTCTVTEGRGSGSMAFNLAEAVEEHCNALVDVLDTVYEKSVKTFFRGQNSRIDEFTQKLEELRLVKAGNMILGDAEGKPYIHIVFVEPTESKGDSE